MIGTKKVLAVIPARGGSKGVPRKNIRLLGGKPLISWSIEAGLKSSYIDKLVVSSEDAEIISIAKKWGADVPFVRPLALSEDDTPGVDPVLHAIEQLPGFDVVVLLQPTSPLRTHEDIDSCISLFASSGANSCLSIAESSCNPHWTFALEHNHELVPFNKDSLGKYVRRQDLPPAYRINGAIYVADITEFSMNRTFFLSRTIGFPMPQDRSVDIDTDLDFKFAEFILHHGKENI